MNRNWASGTPALASTQQLDPLVRLEVPGVEDHRERGRGPAPRAGRRRPSGRPARSASGGSSIWNTGTSPACGPSPPRSGWRRPSPPPRSCRRAWRSRDSAAHSRGPRVAKPGVAELVGDRGVHVHHQGHAQEPGEGRDEVGGLLHRVDHVVAAEGEARHGLRDERHVEERSSRGRPRPSPGPPGAGGCAGGVRPRSGADSPCGKVSRSTSCPSAAERPHQVEHGQRRAPDLEERLRGEEEDPQ